MHRLEGTVLYVSEYSSTISAGVYEEYIASGLLLLSRLPVECC